MKFVRIILGALFFVALPSITFASVNIINNETGGDCATVGEWDASSKICILLSDINQGVKIYGDGITLDGNNHKIYGKDVYDWAGLEINNSNDLLVQNLNIEGFLDGIDIYETQNSAFVNISVANVGYDGVYVDRSNDNFFENIKITNAGGDGFNLQYVNRSVFSKNQIYFADGDGISLRSSAENFVTNNNIDVEGDGVKVFFSRNNLLSQNLVHGHFDAGLASYFSSGNIFVDNNVSDSSMGIWSYVSVDLFYNNNFINNDLPAIILHSKNSLLNTDLPVGGNYWSDYDEPSEGCLDDNSDKICDSPYLIQSWDEESQDNYPWKIPNGWAVPLKPKYSSVAFLPGLEASRLYKQGIFFENKLWEPNWNNDVKKLYLDENGDSKNSGIYTRDVIGEAFGFNVYLKFMETMDDMVATSTIKEWKAFPYDWRFDQIDVASGMVSEIEELAKNSDTGKVTIIAHSNGGLVGKALIDKLKEQGKEKIIDKFIMVAVPQLGTPEAINGLLHGGQRGVLKGWLPSYETTRELGENMQSAYGLLPSQAYFNAVDTNAQPIIEFGVNSATDYLRGVYGNAITSFDNLKKFLLGESGGRTEPTPQNVDEPNVLDAKFLNRAEADHTLFDTWLPPVNIEVTQIAGWGLDTLRGIKYEEQKTGLICNADLSVCTKKIVLDPQPIFTEDGDKTVVIPSATFLAGQKFYINLPDYNHEYGRLRRNRDHADILEAENIRELITKVISKDTAILPENITLEKPSKDEDKKLRISVHSPVSLDLYDTEGNHTGIIPNPNADSDIRLVEENIPNSYYLEMGEGKYAGSDTSAITNIKLVGQALGTFTLKIDEVAGDAVTGSLEFKDVPVMANSIITIDAQNVANASPLKIDIDGDGTNDFSFSELADGNMFFDVFAGIVQDVEIASPYKEELIKDIEKIQKFTGKKEQKNNSEIEEAFVNLEKDVQKFVKKNIISREGGQQLLQIVSIIKDNVLK